MQDSSSSGRCRHTPIDEVGGGGGDGGGGDGGGGDGGGGDGGEAVTGGGDGDAN